MGGDGDDKLLTLGDYRRAARARLSPMAWRYFRSGADGQQTLRENVRAFSRWQLWPRVLVDVAARRARRRRSSARRRRCR